MISLALTPALSRREREKSGTHYTILVVRSVISLRLSIPYPGATGKPEPMGHGLVTAIPRAGFSNILV